ncbi:MAG: cell division protein FtsL [Desulfuromonadales bacterium C00003107]|nr:MAG: cell division protein FtsL [Desulfuromonadales bacterium C00003107]
MAHTIVRPVPKVNLIPLQPPRLLRVFVFLAILLTVSLFFVWSRLQLVNLQYDISKEESRLREANRQVRGLRLEAASLRHPGRIEDVAKKQLALRNPTPQQVVYIKR